MRCRGCTRTIPPHKQNRAHIEKDPVTGRVVGTWHDRCWKEEERRRKQTGAMPGGSYDPAHPSIHESRRVTKDDLTADELQRRETAEKEYVTLRERQAEIAAQRELEDTPGRWDDWRDPEEMTLEELVQETERKREEVSEQEAAQHRT